MNATRIIAIRHGETAWNVATRIQGQLDIGLNATGQWQVKRLGKALAGETIHAIYASDLMRAISKETGPAPQAVVGLRERGFGIFQGNTFAEIEAKWPEEARRWRKRDPHWAPEGGESLRTLTERIIQTTADLARQHIGEQIVLVAHGGVMDALYRTATRQDVQSPRTWNLGNATINRLLWTPEGLSLVGWSDSRHLDGDEALDETTA